MYLSLSSKVYVRTAKSELLKRQNFPDKDKSDFLCNVPEIQLLKLKKKTCPDLFQLT